MAGGPPGRGVRGAVPTALPSPHRNVILRLSRRLSNSSTKSSKSVFQLVPFNLKYINVTLSFTGNGISGKYFRLFHFLKNLSRVKHW